MKVPENLKDNLGTRSLESQHGLMQRTIREIKNAIPEMIVMPDVALDPYSIYGHDGIITNGQVDNDATNEALARMSGSHLQKQAQMLWRQVI